jgi:hemerythrin-like domain-containing protein
MNTWSLLSRQHQELFRKIQLLEEASLDLLSKKIAYEDREKFAEDFVKFFRVGIIQHFKIEESSLFPVLRRNFKDAEPIVSELISEHKTMIDRYFKLQKSKHSKLNRIEDLTTLLKDLSEHAKKEENALPPFIALLDEKQLKKIDELTRQHGYLV